MKGQHSEFKDGSEYQNNSLKHKIKVYVVASLIGSMLFNGVNVFVVGHNGPETPESVSEGIALPVYINKINQAAPAKQFILEYLTKTVVNVRKYPDAFGLIPTLNNSVGREYWQNTFNNACLKDTVYNITNSKINNQTNNSSFNEINLSNPNQLVIQPNNNYSPELIFDIQQNSITPANKTTNSILEAHNCRTSIVSTTSYVPPQHGLL